MTQPSTGKISFYVGDVASNSDALSYHIWTADRAGRLTSFGLGSTLASVAAADTNYNTFVLAKNATAMCTAPMGPASTGVNAPLNDVDTGTLATTIANRAFAAGDKFVVSPTKTGNGLTVTGCFFEAEMEFTD